jgi:cytoskeleton protein RodZ
MDEYTPTPGDDREDEAEATLSFGKKLRTERDSQGLSLEYVAEKTRIGIHHLRALENDDFDALPDDVFVKGYLRAYAECLDADPELVVEAYNLERQSRKAEQAASRKSERDAVVEEMARVLNVSDESNEKRRSAMPLLLTACGIIAVLAVLGTWWVGSLDSTESVPHFPAPKALMQTVNEATPALQTSTPVPVEPPAVVPATKTVPKPAEKPAEKPIEVATLIPEPPPAEKPTLTMPEPTPLSIPNYGVGTAVKNRQLVGQSDSFSEGTKVWFWTDVQGGSSGDKIHHVWLREGIEKNRVTLRIGGSRWRTQSNKMLWADSAGDWAVEARDEIGRVLARHEFVCVP